MARTPRSTPATFTPGRRTAGAFPSRDRVKAWASRFQHDIPENWRLVGENLTAVHSIAYSDLPHIFMGFQVWNEANVCLGWDETLE